MVKYVQNLPLIPKFLNSILLHLNICNLTSDFSSTKRIILFLRVWITQQLTTIELACIDILDAWSELSIRRSLRTDTSMLIYLEVFAIGGIFRSKPSFLIKSKTFLSTSVTHDMIQIFLTCR
jgi:hypothetical protein